MPRLSTVASGHRVSRSDLYDDQNRAALDVDPEAVSEYNQRMRQLLALPTESVEDSELMDDEEPSPDRDSDEESVGQEVFRLFAGVAAVKVAIEEKPAIRTKTPKRVKTAEEEETERLVRIADAAISAEQIQLESQVPWAQHAFSHKVIQVPADQPPSKSRQRRLQERKALRKQGKPLPQKSTMLVRPPKDMPTPPRPTRVKLPPRIRTIQSTDNPSLIRFED
ncbi:hypothetical protein IWQ60_003560 [Tieghemiomyces parasiticus]|uniref:Uncharacterized protein n=1 Tax=Tieghemiomyces parasiticus TaxID=78921 RepID=A0A9W8E0K3_9FUNG|nr:hypothetical protein IWQ60_003560 [Tieghemiomyces parasiticus]